MPLGVQSNKRSKPSIRALPNQVHVEFGKPFVAIEIVVVEAPPEEAAMQEKQDK